MSAFLKVLFFIFLIECNSSAQEKKIVNPHFYEITKNGKTHYLLGTFHYVVQFSDFPKAVHTSFEKSKVLIIEYELNPKLRKTIWRTIDSIKNRPPPKLKDGHLKKLRSLGLPDKLLPFSDSDGAEIYIFFIHSKKYPYYVMDADIMFRAQDAKKKILTLDTKELMENSKNFGPSHTTTLTIGEVLTNMSEQEIRDWGKNSIDSYLAGPDKTEAGSDGGIVFRNKHWLPKILQYYKEHDLTFTAVGNAHLYGKEGLIQKLQDNGYQIRNIR